MCVCRSPHRRKHTHTHPFTRLAHRNLHRAYAVPHENSRQGSLFLNRLRTHTQHIQQFIYIYTTMCVVCVCLCVNIVHTHPVLAVACGGRATATAAAPNPHDWRVFRVCLCNASICFENTCASAQTVAADKSSRTTTTAKHARTQHYFHTCARVRLDMVIHFAAWTCAPGNLQFNAHMHAQIRATMRSHS